MVVFYTMAYNAEQTLPRTVKSVLSQTEQDWVWYLLDNGSQDATGEIIRQYAKEDSRIIPLRNEQNLVFSPETSFIDIANRQQDSDWFCFLDADDEYKPDYLAEMLHFLRTNQLDAAACGFDFINSQTGKIFRRRALQKDLLVMTPEDFGNCFPIYHQFMRTNWAKLFSIKLAKQFDLSRFPTVFYGADTLYTQEMLRHANRFGVLAKPLHRYYMAPKSRSYQWVASRFEADQILHRLACSFLIDKCGTISAENRCFLQIVYCFALADTIGVMRGAHLSPPEVLHECHIIAAHPLTLAAYRECTHESTIQSKISLIQTALEAGAALAGQADGDLRAAMQTLLPRSGQAVFAVNAQMFLDSPELMRALLRDDPDALMQNLLAHMEHTPEVNTYPALKAVQALAVNHPILFQIDDAAFLRTHTSIYWMVWRGETLAALEKMTGLLLDSCVGSGEETFLRLYVSLAAAENQGPAFLFGSTELAWLYLRQGRREECRSMMEELAEMGAGCEELAALNQELEKI